MGEEEAIVALDGAVPKGDPPLEERDSFCDAAFSAARVSEPTREGSPKEGAPEGATVEEEAASEEEVAVEEETTASSEEADAVFACDGAKTKASSPSEGTATLLRGEGRRGVAALKGPPKTSWPEEGAVSGDAAVLSARLKSDPGGAGR